MCYYLRDVTGEIIALVSSAGEVVCHYEYDAYGNHVVLDSNNTIVTSETFIGNINPFRYKGYYFDSETSLYYCMSRYYNPEWCRWISPDDVRYLSFDYVEGLNLYCYCLNNPIMFIDELGDTPIIIFMITIMTIFVSVMILSVDSPNAITRGIVFEKPSILNFGNGEAVILSFMASFGRKDWYLDKKETVSFYISACDITAFAGYSKKVTSLVCLLT